MLDGAKLSFPPTTIQGQDVDLVFRTDVTTVQHEIRTGSIQNTSVLAGVQFLVEELDLSGNQGLSNLEQDRETVALDYEGGVMATELRLQSWEGSEYRWGTGDGDPVTDASGADVKTQLQLLAEAFRRTRIDSTQPLVLEVYEYSESGRFAPLEVIPEQPTLPFDPGERSSTFEGSLTFLNVADLREAVDAAANDGK